jgi:RluA family pseudouridine synthase
MIDVLIDDPWFAVVNKPIDLLTQAVAGIPSLQSLLIDQWRSGQWRSGQCRSEGSNPFVGIPHRLDRMTSGALVVAKNQRALTRLCQQFAARSVQKEYLAWVMGQLDACGSWNDWIRKIPDVAKAEIVDPDTQGARQAELRFETLERSRLATGQPVCLVRIELMTGRMHQIRIQFASRGHPVLGDATYGGAIEWVRQEQETREPMLALHASGLVFSHPKTAERVAAHAPRPTAHPWNLPTP